MGFGFEPRIFGEAFHKFVQIESELFGPLSLVFHLATFIILYLTFRYGNRSQRPFAVYFAINWFFIFAYWGLYAIYYWLKLGIVYLAFFIFSPILLGFIVCAWFGEISNPRIELDFGHVKKYKFFVFLIMLWGLWYPTYLHDQGFILTINDLLFSNYGLMPCPTIMVALGLMTLTYPAGNKRLFNLSTAYALCAGTGAVALGWYPDIPLLIIGIYALGLIVFSKWKAIKGVGHRLSQNSIPKETAN